MRFRRFLSNLPRSGCAQLNPEAFAPALVEDKEQPSVRRFWSHLPDGLCVRGLWETRGDVALLALGRLCVRLGRGLGVCLWCRLRVVGLGCHSCNSCQRMRRLAECARHGTMLTGLRCDTRGGDRYAEKSHRFHLRGAPNGVDFCWVRSAGGLHRGGDAIYARLNNRRDGGAGLIVGRIPVPVEQFDLREVEHIGHGVSFVD